VFQSLLEVQEWRRVTQPMPWEVVFFRIRIHSPDHFGTAGKHAIPSLPKEWRGFYMCTGSWNTETGLPFRDGLSFVSCLTKQLRWRLGYLWLACISGNYPPCCGGTMNASISHRCRSAHPAERIWPLLAVLVAWSISALTPPETTLWLNHSSPRPRPR